MLLALSIGLTGGILIYQSAATTREHLIREHQLLAENRAFALRDNLEILEGELDRLTLLPQIDLNDRDPGPEAQLLLDAHHNSVLYNTAVLVVSADGECIGAVPDRPEYKLGHFGDRPWFQALKTAGPGPVFHVDEDPIVGRTVDIAQPIIRRRKFVGAIIGIIALDQANVIIPGLRDNLPPHTEALLLDRSGRLVFPTANFSAAPDSPYAELARAAVDAPSGTVTRVASGEESLFGYASVGAHTDFVVVFRRPWWVLVEHVQHQARVLLGILLGGVFVAAAAGLLLSAFLTRPLALLRASAARIASGEHGASDEVRPLVQSDELGALVHDFLVMERAIVLRDRALREAAESLERRVAERTRELEVAQKALVDAERFAAMGKTSAAIAHELKNALNGLGIAVELIVENPTHPRAIRLRKQVVSEIDRLRDVVDSLSSFSRSPRIERRREDLPFIVRSAIEALGDLIVDRCGEVDLDLPAELSVDCDGHKIQGVVMNLVKNALEAGHHVRVRAFEGDGEAVIEVADDGAGMSAEAREHMFEPFFTTKPNGTGLGLPTSLRYVQAHGGSLEVGVAEDLGGALVRVRLTTVAGASAATDAT